MNDILYDFSSSDPSSMVVVFASLYLRTSQLYILHYCHHSELRGEYSDIDFHSGNLFTQKLEILKLCHYVTLFQGKFVRQQCPSLCQSDTQPSHFAYRQYPIKEECKNHMLYAQTSFLNA